MYEIMLFRTTAVAGTTHRIQAPQRTGQHHIQPSPDTDGTCSAHSEASRNCACRCRAVSHHIQSSSESQRIAVTTTESANHALSYRLFSAVVANSSSYKLTRTVTRETGQSVSYGGDSKSPPNRNGC